MCILSALWALLRGQLFASYEGLGAEHWTLCIVFVRAVVVHNFGTCKTSQFGNAPAIV